MSAASSNHVKIANKTNDNESTTRKSCSPSSVVFYENNPQGTCILVLAYQRLVAGANHVDRSLYTVYTKKL